jgi:hypothetical protein
VKKVIAIVLFMSLPMEAVEVKPVVNAQLLGGQYYYKGSESSFGGFASLVASPFMKFNEEWSLVPLYSGVYQGTKQVQDLVGGGTLFQDSQNHNVSVKGIRSFGNGLRLKAVTGYGMEFLRETEDEGWTEGLYDNRRLSFGTESEWSWQKDSFVRFAYDFYAIHFPNYQSLSSQAAAVGQGRELDAPDVLDTRNHMLTLAAQVPVIANGLVETSLSQTWTAFPDQHLVDRSGSLVSDLRSDSAQRMSLRGTWPVAATSRMRLFSTLGYTYTHLFSDQNHYDASRTFFNGNYYAYHTHALNSNWTMLLGEAPWTLQLNGTVSRQNYSDRLVQDSTGAYGTETTRVDFATLGLAVSYPIAKGFQVKGSTAFGWNNSNNTYSQLYQYHYNTQTYLMGFTYAY